MAHTASLYNQDTLDDEGFIANFVARQDMLETLLRRLRSAEPDSGQLHQVLIGPRGMGKSSMLRRLAIGIIRDYDLTKQYVPLRFREEQYNVLTLGDFWRNCGEALAEWAETQSMDDVAERIDAAMATRSWAGDDDAMEAFAAEMATLGRRAVLLVDNLDIILDALSEDANWTLRRALQARGGPIMIGAATQALKQSADRRAAFYEFFQPHHLEPLDGIATEACMRALAERRCESGRHVLEVLDTQPARLKTLHTLTGGNPRILALIYRLLESAESDAAMADLERLLDEVTPYYKARVEEYQSAQQRAIIDAIALNWDPVTTSDLSKFTGIATTTLSSPLEKFRKDGLIEKVELSGAYDGHQLVERFLNIWYLMRHGTRRTKQKMRWLVGFLTSFYSPKQLRDIAARAEEAGTRQLWPREFALAMEDAAKFADAAMHERSKARTAAALPLDAGGEISGHAGPDDGDETRRFLADCFSRAKEGFDAGRRDEAIECLDLVVDRFGASDEPALREPVARALFNKGVSLGLKGEADAEIAVYDDLVLRFGASDEPALREQVAKALLYKGITLGQTGEADAEIAVYDDLVLRFGASEDGALREEVAKALLYKGITFGRKGETDAAITVYDDLVLQFGASDEPALREQVAKALLNKGGALGRKGEADAAITVYDDLVLRFGASDEPALREEVAKALLNKGIMFGQTGETDAEIAVYDDLVLQFGASDEPALREPVAMVLFNKGASLGRKGDVDAEIAVYDDLVLRFGASDEPAFREPVAKALLSKGVALGRKGDVDAAIAVYDDLVLRFGASDEPALRELVAKALLNKGIMFGQTGETDAEIAVYEDVIQRFKGVHEPEEFRSLKNDALVRLGNLYFDHRGDFKRARSLYGEATPPNSLSANANLAWLSLASGEVSDAAERREQLDDLPQHGRALLDAALSIASENFGASMKQLAPALGGELDEGAMNFEDDLNRLIRLIEAKGYGERFIGWFEENGFADRLAPIYVALKAYVRGETLLRDANPEVRGPAGVIFDRLDAPRRYQLGMHPAEDKPKRRRGRPRKR